MLEDREVDHRRVAQTTVGDIWVSTVWLGLDHSLLGRGAPMIFETLCQNTVTGEWLTDTMTRYSTEAEAIAGHDQIAARMRDQGQIIEEENVESHKDEGV